MKTKGGRASEKCRKKAGRSSTFDSEVWRPGIEEHSIRNYVGCMFVQAEYIVGVCAGCEVAVGVGRVHS